MIIISNIQSGFLDKKPDDHRKVTKKKIDESKSFIDHLLNETKDYDPQYVMDYFSGKR